MTRTELLISKVKTVEEKCDSFGTRLGAHELRLGTIQKEITTIKGDISNASIKQIECEQKIDSVKQDVIAIKNIHQKNTNDIDLILNDVKLLMKYKNEHNKAHAKVDSRLENVEDEMKSIKSFVDNIRNLAKKS